MCGRGRYALQAQKRLNNIAQHQRFERAVDNQHNSNQVISFGNVDEGTARSSLNSSNADESSVIIENMSPGMCCPLLVNENGCIVVRKMTWGLIPKFSDICSKPDHYKLFNKRIDTLLKNGYYRNLLEVNRCVVVLDGFYEWKGAPGKKVPHYVCFRDGPMQIAGIYELSKRLNAGTNEIENFPTFSILTGEPSAKFSALHNREPVLMTDEQAEAWLAPGRVADHLLSELMRNPEEAELPLNREVQFYAVSGRMTSPSYQGGDCSQPAASSSASIASHFANVTQTGDKRSSDAIDNSQSVSPSAKKQRASSGESPHRKKTPSSNSTANKISNYFGQR